MEKLGYILQSAVAWFFKILLAHIILLSFLLRGLEPDRSGAAFILAFHPPTIAEAYSIEGFKGLLEKENLYILSIILLLGFMYFLLYFVRIRRVRKEYLSRCAEEVKKEESNHQHAEKFKEFTPEDLNLNESKK